MADMIVCGIAVPNEEFDPERLYDIMFHITDPDVFEWEQKGFTLGPKRPMERQRCWRQVAMVSMWQKSQT